MAGRLAGSRAARELARRMGFIGRFRGGLGSVGGGSSLPVEICRRDAGGASTCISSRLPVRRFGTAGADEIEVRECETNGNQVIACRCVLSVASAAFI